MKGQSFHKLKRVICNCGVHVVDLGQTSFLLGFAFERLRQSFQPFRRNKPIMKALECGPLESCSVSSNKENEFEQLGVTFIGSTS